MMNLNFDYYTGTLTYKQIEFAFIFDKHKLKIIPPPDKYFEIENWFYEKINNEMYVDTGKPVYIESDYLEGFCNETSNKIVFLPKRKCIDQINNCLIISIFCYIVYTLNCSGKINRMRFYGIDIDKIYPVNKAVNSVSFDKNGSVGISTKSINDSKSETLFFKVKENKIGISFIITRTINSVNSNPIQLFSMMEFTFEETDNFVFIKTLFHYARMFIQYLCYRKEINISRITLCFINDKSHIIEHAYFFLCENCGDADGGEKGRVILQSYIAGKEAEILQSIANNTIFAKHIPKTYYDSKIFDAARFIMVTSAFEWEFSQLFPNARLRSDKRITAESKAEKEIDLLAKESKGELKKIYKYLKLRIKDRTLESKICYAYNELKDILAIFSKQLYSINYHNFKYKDMATRLSSQRNSFAHGHMDKDFKGEDLLDIMFLERMIYSMQLKRIGLSKENIQFAINNLFACHLTLK